MNRTLVVLLLTAVLSGCAASSPELRPYTADETRELALEALNRRGLSFDEYHAKKAELLGTAQKNTAFDEHGQMSAEQVVQQPGRSS
ncbi:lipoprotein [Pseudomonas citri]|uniref:lipoprotein n=1 Tax=Pseudomonas citri TaxID=2978349 RepID=UPI0021B61F28|nr:lipoprotein [Pseudomonas citri]